ncbi:MAG: permease-like cell division protein FtsX [Actinomycetota bacterium]
MRVRTLTTTLLMLLLATACTIIGDDNAADGGDPAARAQSAEVGDTAGGASAPEAEAEAADLAETEAAEGGEEELIRAATAQRAAVDACLEAAPMRTAVVWLATGTSPDEAADLEETLRQTPSITDYRYIDQEATYEAFTTAFADEPEVIELVAPETLPTSFEVRYRREVDEAALLAELEQFPFFDTFESVPDALACQAEQEALTIICSQPATEVAIWLEPGVTDRTLGTVGRLLDDSDLIDRFRYVGPAETYAEFENGFSDDPDVLDVIDPDTLHTRFAVHLVARTETADERSTRIDELEASLLAVQGVDSVEQLWDLPLRAACAGADPSDTPLTDLLSPPGINVGDG